MLSRLDMLLSSLFLFSYTYSIFVSFAETQLSLEHRWRIKFVQSAFDIFLKLELASWILLMLMMNSRRPEMGLFYNSYPGPVVNQWQSSGNPVCLEFWPKCTLECHWCRKFLVASVFPVCFRWSFSGLQVVFHCVPIVQINTGLPPGHHWMIAQASVVPVESVQWYPRVLTESGLEVIRSGHFPARNPLGIQLVWRELLELSWFHLNCNPKYTKTSIELISKACTNGCWSTHTFEQQNWYPLQQNFGIHALSVSPFYLSNGYGYIHCIDGAVYI